MAAACALTYSTPAQSQVSLNQVAFVGGNATYQWEQSPAFENLVHGQGAGFTVPQGAGGCRESATALSVVQQLANAGPNKPKVIHLMIGQDDSLGGITDSNPYSAAITDFETCFAKVVQTVQANKMGLIVGTIPFSVIADVRPYNGFIYAYCAAHNIPVIDYYTAFDIDTSVGDPDILPATGGGIYPTMTMSGWVLMSNLAVSQINQVFNGVKLRSGYLNNLAQLPDGADDENPYQNLNTVVLGTRMQWMAEGQYSNGLTYEINNANINGVVGTWWSTNPAVMSITPTGQSFAIEQGTTNIKFMTLAGQTLSEWTMYVTPNCHPNVTTCNPAPVH